MGGIFEVWKQGADICAVRMTQGEAGPEAPSGSCPLSLQPAHPQQRADREQGLEKGRGAPGDSGDTRDLWKGTLVTDGSGPPQRGQAEKRAR